VDAELPVDSGLPAYGPPVVVFLLFLAGLLALGSALLVRSAVGSSRRAARLTAIAPTGCGELVDEAGAVASQLGRAALSREAEITGTGRPAGTPLLGPFSGQPVLWYSATITHHYWKTTTSTDNQGRSSRSRTRAKEVVSTEVSDAARLGVADGTGTVEVALRGARIDEPRLLHDRMQPPAPGTGRPSFTIGPFTLGGGSSTIGYQHVELALLPGEELYVCGTVRPAAAGGVELAAVAGRELLVSTRSEQELIRSYLRSAQLKGAGAVAVGLVTVAALVGAVTVLI